MKLENAHDTYRPGMIIDSKPKYDEMKMLRDAVQQLKDDVQVMREQLFTLAGYTRHLPEIAAIRKTK